MRRLSTALCAAALSAGFGIVFGAAPAPAQQARTCIHDWAKPGEYRIVGEFQGRVQSTTARLTSNCRVYIDIPGVFTGGSVIKAGNCVRFGFRVQGEPDVYAAEWCGRYALVPLEGTTVRAEVYRVQ